jgi:uncharacterized protein (DUF305 family)
LPSWLRGTHIALPSSTKELEMSIITLAARTGAGLVLCTGLAMAQSNKPGMEAMHAKPGASGAQSSSSPGHGSEAMHKTMMAGMTDMQKMKMSGDTDRDFASMMRMHHEQAIEMASMQIQHGKSPELKAMAKKIIADQKKEIAQFDAWLKKNP